MSLPLLQSTTHKITVIPSRRSIDLQAADRNALHIAIVTETYPPEVNGVALTLGHLVSGLRERGQEVSLIRPRQRGEALCREGELAATLVRGLALPVYREVRVGLPSRKTLRRCWTHRRPDVAYVATEGPLGWSALRVARDLGIPVLSGFHTNFHSYLDHYHAGWMRFIVLQYLRRFHGQGSGTLVPNPELRRQLRQLGFKNVKLLGRGVDTNLFHPRRRSPALRRAWGASGGDLVALYVGRLAPEKNLELAIGAYREMKRFAPSVKCVLVGDGPLRASLEKKYPDVIFCGVQTGESLAEHYASADVFLFPSLTETFGNVTVEAMASGLAVVAFDYAAARIHIVDNESGMLAPCGASQSFVQAAVKIAAARETLARVRLQARAHAATLDWRLVVDKFLTLLSGTIETNARTLTAPQSAVEALVSRHALAQTD
jgi:glycosyltransferase involved in cell wall biosynthesis